MSAQQIADIMILGGAVAFGVYGMWRGAIRQLGSVAAFLCAFLMARLFGLDMADWLGGVNPMIGYTLVFALVFIGISLIASVLKFTANLLMLGAVDRLAGLVIGALKWLLLMSILLNLAQLADIGLPVYGSRIVTATADLAPWLFGYAAGII